MSRQPNAFLARLINVWEMYRTPLAQLGVENALKGDDGRGTLAIELSSPSMLGVLQAWEHASCLDFTYMLLPDGEGVILFAGPCVNPDDLETRLRSLFECVVRLHSQRSLKVLRP